MRLTPHSESRESMKSAVVSTKARHSYDDERNDRQNGSVPSWISGEADLPCGSNARNHCRKKRFKSDAPANSSGEEKAADKKLNSLAEGGVNRRATGRTASGSSARSAAASSSDVKRKTAAAKRRTVTSKKNRSR